MINCSEATRLMSRSLDQPLTWKENWKLRFHLAMCLFCRRYQTQLRWIDRVLALLLQGKSDDNP